MAPRYILHNALAGANLNVVTWLDDAHKRYLNAANKIFEGILQAQRKCNAANTQSGYQGCHINVEARCQNKADPYAPHHHANNVNEN